MNEDGHPIGLHKEYNKWISAPRNIVISGAEGEYADDINGVYNLDSIPGYDFNKDKIVDVEVRPPVYKKTQEESNMWLYYIAPTATEYPNGEWWISDTESKDRRERLGYALAEAKVTDMPHENLVWQVNRKEGDNWKKQNVLVEISDTGPATPRSQ